jgi:SPP1 gp7 family putative phage head morphogenesis protein
LPEDVDEIFDEEKEKKSLSKLLLPFFLLAFQKGVEQGTAQGSGNTKPEDLFSQYVKQALEEQALKHAQLAVGTTKDHIAGVLQDAIDEGKSVQQLATDLREMYDVESKSRALTIARTELTRVINDATVRALAEEGYTEKEWSTVIDGRERETHNAANGQVVGIYESFTVGGAHCQAPGDENLPPQESINCRCTCLGGGLTTERKRAVGQWFLRTHGALEKRFVVSLLTEFSRQKRRVLSHFPS